MIKIAVSLNELDHFNMFHSGLRLGDWVWCLHCERAFQYGEYREEPADSILRRYGLDRLQLCPYDDCDGSPLDLRPWGEVRKTNLEYPVIPDREKVYPLYGSGRQNDHGGLRS